MTLFRGLGGLLALVAAAGLGLQLKMFVDNHGLPLGPWRWLGFFTVWSNLLAVAAGAATLIGRTSGLGGPRVRLVVLAALAAIWLGYAQLIRADLGETGTQRIVAIILHDVTPPIAAALWLAGPHGALRWRDLAPVLAWPALFLLVAETRGRVEDWYPYGYLDPASGVLPQALVAILLMIGAIGAGAILLDRKLA